MANYTMRQQVVLLNTICLALVGCRPELGSTASRYSWLLDVASTEDDSGTHQFSGSGERADAATAQSLQPTDGSYTHIAIDGMPMRSDASSYARQGTSDVLAQQTNNYSPIWAGKATVQQASNGTLNTGDGSLGLTVKGLVPQKPPVVEPNTTRQIVIPITPSNVTYTNGTNGTTQGAVWITTLTAHGGYEGADGAARGGDKTQYAGAGQQPYLRGATAEVTAPADGLSAMQSGSALLPRGTYAFKADSGNLLARCARCSQGTTADQAFVHVGIDGLAAAGWSHWTVKSVGNNQVALQSDSLKYLARCYTCTPGASVPNQAFVHVTDYTNSPWAIWTVVDAGGGKVGLKADNGLFLARCHDCIASAQRPVSPDAAFVHVTALDGNPWAKWTPLAFGDWTCLNTQPGLTTVNVPMRLNPDGDVQCMSIDGQGCMWTRCPAVDPVTYVRPLQCGEPHRLFYGITGYDTPGHWCSLAQRYLLSTAVSAGGPWKCVDSVGQTGIKVTDNGDISCYSGDGYNCQWGNCRYGLVKTAVPSLAPLTCGMDAYTKYGTAGYSEHLHWCSAGMAASVAGTLWRCASSIVSGPFRMRTDLNIECMSMDGRTCLTGDCASNAQLPPAGATAVVCGDNLLGLTGSTGYDSPSHWCYKARQLYTGCTSSVAAAYAAACQIFPNNCPFQPFPIMLGNPCYGDVGFFHNINAGARLIGLDFWLKNSRFAAVRARMSGARSQVWGDKTLAASSSPAKQANFLAGDFAFKMMAWPSTLTGFLGAIYIEMTSAASDGTPNSFLIKAHDNVTTDIGNAHPIDVGSGTMLGAVTLSDSKYVYGFNILFMKDIEFVLPRITYPTISWALLDAQLQAYASTCFENGSPTEAQQAQCSVSQTLTQDWSVSRDEAWTNTQGWGIGTTLAVSAGSISPVSTFEVSLQVAANYQESTQYGLTTTQTFGGSKQISFSNAQTFNVPARQVAICKMSYSNKTADVPFRGNYEFHFRDDTTFNLNVSGIFRSVALSSFNLVVAFANCTQSPCCGG